MEAVYYQPSKNKQVKKKEYPFSFTYREEREIKEFIEQVNDGIRARHCIGIDDMDRRWIKRLRETISR